MIGAAGCQVGDVSLEQPEVYWSVRERVPVGSSDLLSCALGGQHVTVNVYPSKSCNQASSWINVMVTSKNTEEMLITLQTMFADELKTHGSQPSNQNLTSLVSAAR